MSSNNVGMKGEKKLDVKALKELIEACEPEPLQNRPGTFAITTMGGEIFTNEVQRQELRLIMENLVILQAQHIKSLDQLTYVALCEQFRPIRPGEIIPAYLPMFELDENGKAAKCVWEESVNYAKSKQERA